MKKIILKIGVACLSLFVALTALFVPFKKSNSIDSASALSNSSGVTLPNNISFTSNEIQIVRPAVSRQPLVVEDFSDYLIGSPNFIGSSNLFLDSFALPLTFNINFASSNSSTLGFSYSVFAFTYDYYFYSSSDNPSPLYSPPTTIPLDTYLNFDVGVDNYVNISSQPIALYENSSYPYDIKGYTCFGFSLRYNATDVDTIPSPTLVMKSLKFSNSYDFESFMGYEPSYSNSYIFIYTDTAGYEYSFYIPSCLADTYNWYYSNRTYYFDEAFNFTDNDYYNQGVEDGYNVGYNEGESDGYSDGYSSGLNTGKNIGYNEGLEANDRLTFSGLMTSVIDVPVKVFVNLFDFDILGVNILVFLSTLLTICLVLFLIKKIKGA